MAPPDLEVHRIVTGRHLDHAGAELRVDGAVGDHAHRDRSLDRRDLDGLPHVLGVPLVPRVNGETGVADLRLRPHRAERERPVLDVDELRVALLVLHLNIGEHRLAARAPVDDVVALVDQPFLPEAHEDLAHRPREAGVHGEALPRPIARGPQPPELADDGAAGFFLPLPDARRERLAPEVFLCLALQRELLLDLDLGGDPRVVRAGNPERIEAIHALVADQNVLEGIVERMPPVQRAGDIRGRDHDRVRAPRCGGVRVKVSALLPEAVPARLHAGGIIAIGHFGHGDPSL